MGITSLTSERGSFHLLLNYGTILPSTGATFCHCRAQNNASGEKFRYAYHRHSEYAFRLLEAWFCSWVKGVFESSFLAYTELLRNGKESGS